MRAVICGESAIVTSRKSFREGVEGENLGDLAGIAG
jgi:hypothetical protein